MTDVSAAATAAAKHADPHKRPDRFARLGAPSRVWLVASVHGEAERLARLHGVLAQRAQPLDRLVYAGNLMGWGPQPAQTIDEALAFRRWFIAQPRAVAEDVVFLRGMQEEMWSKLLQTHFAPKPADIMLWLSDHGVTATLHAYGGSWADGLAAADQGPQAVARWLIRLREAMSARPGHNAYMSALRCAAYTDPPDGLLFVNAGIDPTRTLAQQSDAFWWGWGAFNRLDERYLDYRKVVRGYDPAAAGMTSRDLTLSIDAGSGRGGPLVAVAVDAGGQVVDAIQA